MSVWTMDRAWTTETLATTGLVKRSIWSNLFKNFSEIGVWLRVLPPARSPHRREKFSEKPLDRDHMDQFVNGVFLIQVCWAWYEMKFNNTAPRHGVERQSFLQEQ
jgi:hypothetical protein